VFLLYPSVCKMAFSAFNCLPVEVASVSGETTKSVLLDDDLVTCEDGKHRTFIYLSLFVILVVSFGVPIFFGIMVFIKARRYGIQQRQLAAQETTVHDTNGANKEAVDAQRASAATLALRASQANWGDARTTAADPVELAAMEAAIRDVTVLSDFAILVESYKPTFVYWEVRMHLLPPFLGSIFCS
jgi:hypothetical protein